MADFKLHISHKGKSYQKEAKAEQLLGKAIGQTVKGEAFDLPGYELTITGGSDNCGFPMRSGIKGRRAKLSLLGGTGLAKRQPRGTRKRTTVCGGKITDTITQVNLSVAKEGSAKLDTLFAAPAEAEKKE